MVSQQGTNVTLFFIFIFCFLTWVTSEQAAANASLHPHSNLCLCALHGGVVMGYPTARAV